MDASSASWSAVYPDGRAFSDTETSWGEVSVLRPGLGNETLAVARDHLASLSAHVNGRAYTLRAPDETARFFRHYHGRTSLHEPGVSQVMYHAIGYVTEGADDMVPMKVTLEIDPAGNAVLRPIQLLPRAN
jgi:hypothetical protein